jgi:hypothetical protein
MKVAKIAPKVEHLHMVVSFQLPDVNKHTEHEPFTMVLLQPAYE